MNKVQEYRANILVGYKTPEELWQEIVALKQRLDARCTKDENCLCHLTKLLD